jgi:precorrin-4 methylase
MKPEKVVGRTTWKDEQRNRTHVVQVTERVDVQDIRETRSQEKVL